VTRADCSLKEAKRDARVPRERFDRKLVFQLTFLL
jgi:hypothetical protein